MANRLYVGNLSFDATQDGLVAAFEQDGRKVKDVNVVTDRDTGRPRGFAFVEMANQADAEAAIQAMDGSELNGRPLKVSLAKERPSRGGGRDRVLISWIERCPPEAGSNPAGRANHGYPGRQLSEEETMSDHNLTVKERQMLEKAAEAGGHFSIRGLLPAEMTHAADVALALHRLGLMNEPFIQKTFEKGTSIIEQITVGLTDEGREYLAQS